MSKVHFTGAVENRKGLLKAADGGLLFLDEIGELGLDEQAMLLEPWKKSGFSRWVPTARSRATSS